MLHSVGVSSSTNVLKADTQIFAAGAVPIHFNIDKRKSFSELPHLLDVLSLNLLLSNTNVWLQITLV